MFWWKKETEKSYLFVMKEKIRKRKNKIKIKAYRTLMFTERCEDFCLIRNFMEWVGLGSILVKRQSTKGVETMHLCTFFLIYIFYIYIFFWYIHIHLYLSIYILFIVSKNKKKKRKLLGESASILITLWLMVAVEKSMLFRFPLRMLFLQKSNTSTRHIHTEVTKIFSVSFFLF